MADFYIDPVISIKLRTNTLGNQDWSKIAYRCFYAAYLIEMSNWIIRRLKEHLKDPPADVLKSLQVEWGDLQLSEKSESMFWDPIVKRTKTLFCGFFVSFDRKTEGDSNFFVIGRKAVQL